MNIKKISIFALLIVTTTSYAAPTSLIGGKAMQESNAHYVALGWPSIAYEWWNAGSNMDWAIGGELVYGDWSGEFSNVDIGVAVNIPLRWHLHQEGRTNVAFKLAPGGLIGSVDAPGSDLFVFGMRAEMGVPISIELNDKVNLITGASVPFTVMFVENADAFVVIPIMPRIGVEFAATPTITPFFLMELGPTIAAGGGFGTEVELGLRAWVGSVFW